jgi:hypothetical protein
MKNKYVSLIVATALGFSLLATAPAHAASLSDLGDINLKQYNGFDDLTELWGDDFACISVLDNQSKNLDEVFTSTVEDIIAQLRAWMEENSLPSSGNATWDPVQPPALKLAP